MRSDNKKCWCLSCSKLTNRCKRWTITEWKFLELSTQWKLGYSFFLILLQPVIDFTSYNYWCLYMYSDTEWSLHSFLGIGIPNLFPAASRSSHKLGYTNSISRIIERSCVSSCYSGFELLHSKSEGPSFEKLHETKYSRSLKSYESQHLEKFLRLHTSLPRLPPKTPFLLRTVHPISPVLQLQQHLHTSYIICFNMRKELATDGRRKYKNFSIVTLAT